MATTGSGRTRALHSYFTSNERRYLHHQSRELGNGVQMQQYYSFTQKLLHQKPQSLISCDGLISQLPNNLLSY